MTRPRSLASPLSRARGALRLCAGALLIAPMPATAAEPGSLNAAGSMSMVQIVVILVLGACLVALIGAVLHRERREPEVIILDAEPGASAPSAARVPVDGLADDCTRRARITTPARVFEEPPAGSYSAAECADFVSGLGDSVAKRALVLFAALRDEGRISARKLARELDISTRSVSGSVTGRLSRRASELELPLPYEASRPGRTTVWHDRDGIARRMAAALEQELALRPGRASEQLLVTNAAEDHN